MVRASVEVYPALPPGGAGAGPGAVFRVAVEGLPVPVERYAGVSYVRFAFRGRVAVDIGVDGPPGEHRVLPGHAVERVAAGRDRIRLTIVEPSSFVAWVGEREKLFVFADRLEEGPRPGDDGVIAVASSARGPATGAIQAAIDEAAARPRGGMVFLPPGRHRTGTLRLASHVTLYLAPGALLEGIPDPAAYPVDPGRTESARDESLAPDARFWGRTMTFSRLLLVDDATDVHIRGRGTIAGNGRLLRTRFGAVPNLVRVRGSSGVSIEDVLLRDAAAWTLHLLACDDVSVANVRIVNDRDNLNTDGIDPDMSTHVRIDRAFVYTRDDAICVKATGNGGFAGDVSDVRVTNSVVSSRDAALKVGTESSATVFADVTFEGCTVFESGRAMSVVVRDGAVYERIAFRRITVDRAVDHLVEQVIGVRDPAADLGVVRDLSFEDIVAPAYPPPPSAWTWYAQFRPGRPGRAWMSRCSQAPTASTASTASGSATSS